jgi:lipopolysaccharide heptosyltransferase II
VRERVTTAVTLVLGRAVRRFMRPPSLQRLHAPAPRVAVLKPCCLGDVIMTTPALQALHQGLPGVRITYGVSRYARPAIAASPLVERLLDTGPVGVARPLSWTYLSGYLRLWADLRAARFDACVVLDRSPLLAVLPWLAGIPIRAGIDSAGRGFALNLRLPWTETRHESDLYLGVAALLGVPTAAARLHIAASPADEAAAAAVWAGLVSAPADRSAPDRSATGARVVALAPGGGVNPGMALRAKRWPAASYAALGRRLVQERGATIVLVGGLDDAALHRVVLDAMGVPAHDLAGRLSLGALGALLRRCRLFVGNDSAPMHVAAAAGVPLVALFGPTNPAMYAPYTDRAIVITPDPPAPGSTVSAIERIPVERVWAACQELLEQDA